MKRSRFAKGDVIKDKFSIFGFKEGQVFMSHNSMPPMISTLTYEDETPNPCANLWKGWYLKGDDNMGMDNHYRVWKESELLSIFTPLNDPENIETIRYNANLYMDKSHVNTNKWCENIRSVAIKMRERQENDKK